MPNVQIVVEGDTSGLNASLDRINQQAAQLSSGFGQVASASDQATSRMSSGFERSRESARLLREETGIFLPRALQGVIAQSQLLGPALNAAFSGLAVVGFVQVLASVPKAIDGVIEKFTGAKAALDAMNSSQAALNKSLEQMNKELEQTQRRNAVIGMSSLGAAQTNLGFRQADIAAQQKVVSDLKQQLADMQKATVPTDLVLPSGEVIGGAGPAVPKFDTDAIQKVTKQYEEAQVKLKQFQADAEGAEKELAKIGSQEDVDQMTVYNRQFDETIKKTEQLYELARKAAQEKLPAGLFGITKLGPVSTFEARTAPQSLLGMPAVTSEDVNFVSTAWARGTQAFKGLNQEMMVNIETDQRVAEEGKRAAEQYARAWTSARDVMANSLDQFFFQLTSGNIGQAFLRQFEKLVSQMVATWLVGVRGIAGISRSGGFFGDLLGMGGPAFSASGVLDSTVLSGALGGGAFNFSNGFTPGEASMLGIPLSGGGGGAGVSLSSLPAGALSIGTGGSGRGGFLASLGRGISSLLPLGALAGGAALLGRGGLAGLAGGGLLGFGAGAVAGPLLTGIAESLFLSGGIGAGLATTLATVGSFLGPIGAGIGLVAGLIGLFTGNGKRKEQQTQVLQDMERQLDLLQNSYNLHAISYTSAISQAEQIRKSYTAQQEQIQKGGGPSRVDPLGGRDRELHQQSRSAAAKRASRGGELRPGAIRAGRLRASLDGTHGAWIPRGHAFRHGRRGSRHRARRRIRPERRRGEPLWREQSRCAKQWQRRSAAGVPKRLGPRRKER